jgi:hypothetical protein
MKPHVLEPLAVRQFIAQHCLPYRRSGMLELQPHYLIATALGSWLAHIAPLAPISSMLETIKETS